MEFDTRFQHPFSMLVAGASGTGKTRYVKELLSRVHPPFRSVTWFYSEWQPEYAEGFPAHVEFVRGLPPNLMETLMEKPAPRCAVFDDLMMQCAASSTVAELFVQKRHHADLSVILVLQNLYVQGKEMRNIHLNTQYLTLFSSPRDKSQLYHFARQVEPTRSKFVMEAYRDATSKPYGHLLIDLKPRTPEELRYRSQSLSSDEQTVYRPS